MTSISAYVGKLEPLYPAGGDVKWYSCYRNSIAGPQKLKKTRITIGSSNSNLGHIPKRTKSRGLNRLCANSHCSKKVEVIQMPINKLMD